ncbi:MAG: helix-turn-helix transcriptional regulator [Sphingobacteriales bacterium]|nr:helix-turn-helix transcriptional regulator [Sphingobacteriales bacterium]
MKSIQLYRDVEITVKELKSNASDPHKHHFFELIYVLEGTGVHNINKNDYEFKKGDVFLLTPEDAHTFKGISSTKFCIIDFTKSFFSKSAGNRNEKMDVSEFFKRLEFIFHNHNNIKGSIALNADKVTFETLINQLISEKQNNQLFGEIITQNVVFLLLHLIARNIHHNISKDFIKQNPKSKIYEITAYIQQNIYDKELLKIETISSYFNKSPDHLNRYFKKQTGSTIKDYIIRYKLNLIQTRLKFSDLTISEIAYEMNFTDESHLNKVFKSVFCKTAKQFRKEEIVKLKNNM